MESLLRQVAIWICVPVYKTIPKLYSIFYFLSNARFLEKGVVDQLSKNLYVLVSVVMLFAFSATLLSAIVNPDVMESGKNKVWAVFKRAVLGIVLIVAVPFMFDLAYQLQNGIMKNATIEKLILGINTSSSAKYGSENGPAQGGQLIAGKLISSVVYPYDTSVQVSNPLVGPAYQRMVKENIDSIGVIATYINIAPSNNTNNTYAFEFDAIVAIIAGIAVDYVLLLYSLDMAVRMFILAFLEITAPIAILAYIALGNKYIVNWAKQVGTTFAEVFVKVAAMGFYLFFIARINTFLNTPALWGISETDTVNSISGFGWRLLLQAIIIVGLLTFVRRIPNYINAAFGTNMGNGPRGLAGRLQPVTDSINDLNRARQGIGRVVGSTAAVASNIGSRMVGAARRDFRNSEGQNMARRIAGAVGAGLTGAGVGALTSVGAARRGWQTGNLTAIGNEVARERDTHPDGSTAPGRIADILTQTIGMGTALDRANDRIMRENRLMYNGQHYTEEQLNRIRGQYNNIQTNTQHIIDAATAELNREDSNINHTYTFTDSEGNVHNYANHTYHQMADVLQALRESGPQADNYRSALTGQIDINAFHEAQQRHQQQVSLLEDAVRNMRQRDMETLVNEAINDGSANHTAWAVHNRAHDASNGQQAYTNIQTVNQTMANNQYARDVTQRTVGNYNDLENMNTQATTHNDAIQQTMDVRQANIDRERSTDNYRRRERNNQANEAYNRDNRIHPTDQNANNNYQ